MADTTLLTLREAVYHYLQVDDSGSPSTADLTRGSTDLLLVAVNNAIQMAQRNHDFHLLYDTIEVTVDPVTGVRWQGGSTLATTNEVVDLDTVKVPALPIYSTILYNTDTFFPSVTRGNIVRFDIAGRSYTTIHTSDDDGGTVVGLSGDVVADETITADVTVYESTNRLAKLVKVLENTNGNLQPVKWDTQHNLANQLLRNQEVQCQPLYRGSPFTETIVQVSGGQLFYPGITESRTLYLTGYLEMPKLVLDTDTHFLLTHGFDWLMWSVIIELDHLTKQFVFRQEGNKGEPVALAKRAWESLVAWDSSLYSQKYHFID